MGVNEGLKYRFFVFFSRMKRAGVHYAPLGSCVREECGFQGIPRSWPSGRVDMWSRSAAWRPVAPHIHGMAAVWAIPLSTHGGGRSRVVPTVVGDLA